MLNLLKKMFNFESSPTVDFSSLVASGAVIVDVRTPQEFNGGHIKGAINIPLDVLGTKGRTMLDKNTAVITCCRSGGRSGAAIGVLRDMGIEAYNGGPWDSLQSQLK